MSEYKYIVFIFALILGVPAGVVLIYSSKLWEKIVLFIMLFFTCNLAGTINFYSEEHYRGTSRGFEIGIVDLVTLMFFFLILLKPKFKLRIPRGSFLYLIYFLISVISIKNSAVTLYSWFEVLAMVKMYFYFLVWYNYFIDFDHIQQVINMFPVLIVYIFMMTVYQWRMGIYQPPGPFPHQNSLSMYIVTIAGILLATLLEVKLKQFWMLYVVGVFGLCCLIECLTLSRGGVICYGGCCALIIFLSFTVGFKAKKVLIFILVCFISLVGVLSYANSIYNRFMYAPESSWNCRENLATSAINMANDKFFGIGLNNFGVKVNADYPYSKHKMPPGFKEGLVESIYLMVAAETGWLNLGVLITFFAYFYIVNLRNIFRYRDHRMVYLPIGLAGGLAAIFAQSYLEWVLKQRCNFYQMMLFFAMIMTMDRLYRQNGKQGKTAARVNVFNAGAGENAQDMSVFYKR